MFKFYSLKRIHKKESYNCVQILFQLLLSSNIYGYSYTVLLNKHIFVINRNIFSVSVIFICLFCSKYKKKIKSKKKLKSILICINLYIEFVPSLKLPFLKKISVTCVIILN